MPQKDVSDDSDFNGASSPFSSSSSSISTSDTFPQNVSHRRLSVRYFMFSSLSSSPLVAAAASSSCVCLVFVLNMDCVCVCLFVCVCESVCSRNCVAHFLRMPTMATATALVSAAWNTFFVSMETGMICPQPETCSMLWPPSPSPPFSPHYTLVSFRPDRSVTGKTTRDFPSTIFQSLPRLLVSRSYLFLKVVSDSLTRKTIWTHKGFWE